MARIWGRFAAILLVLTAFSAGPWGLGAAAAQEKAAATENESTPKKPRPKSGSFTQLAAGELVRIDQQIQAQNDYLASIAMYTRQRRQVEPLRDQITALKDQAATICESDNDARQQFRNQLQGLIERLQATVEGMPPWQPLTEENLCRDGQPVLILEEIAATTNIPDQTSEQKTVEAALIDLTEQRDEVLRGMTDDLAGASVADNIKWLMLIIFGVGAVTLAGVKIFSAEVQQELVASGQIVQFVTILILLGVILALGLAQRLQAETLGTLLGGLAGYVLSQGVGRQAQRSVLNEIKSAAAGGAPPPPAGPTPPPVEPVPGAEETRPG